ncbi:hypothetical protein [Streptomyces fumanus]|uniref:Uncharacterized protein n=1 Tax=Streptomyces fumanus TaxID=67302 RepID=A0A919DZ23_9ACTN|nr:hypothetical protein [Streptomyces fumanus]GHE92715.1 hypothetical protein GCM10018772_15490 [Streptomyces fumanus]
MELLGILMVVLVHLTLGVTHMLDSMAFRIRARGTAEIIRAEHGSGLSDRKHETRGNADV